MLSIILCSAIKSSAEHSLLLIRSYWGVLEEGYPIGLGDLIISEVITLVGSPISAIRLHLNEHLADVVRLSDLKNVQKKG